MQIAEVQTTAVLSLGEGSISILKYFEFGQMINFQGHFFKDEIESSQTCFCSFCRF